MKERKEIVKQRIKKNPEEVIVYNQKEAIDCFVCEKYDNTGVIVYNGQDDYYASLCNSCKKEIEKELKLNLSEQIQK